jgi:hypothetical protein
MTMTMTEAGVRHRTIHRTRTLRRHNGRLDVVCECGYADEGYFDGVAAEQAMTVHVITMGHYDAHLERVGLKRSAA